MKKILLIRTFNQFVYKETKNGLPPFRPNLSSIGTPIYKLAKFLLPFLTPLTKNEYNVSDLFDYVEEICKPDPNLHVASQDVESLFTNIPLDKTIVTSVSSLYNDNGNTLRFLRMFFAI